MSGAEIPRVGLGTWGRAGKGGLEAILTAIELGYRHLDTAQTYDTEQIIGRAIPMSGLDRREFFVTTKVADTNLKRRHFLPSLRGSLDRLGMDRVDLMLIHWPSRRDEVPFEEYMEELAQARALGLTRLVGVSNFPAALVRRSIALLGAGAIATNQVEMHPYLQNRVLRACCAEHDVPVTAYLPLAGGRVAQDPVLRRIGTRLGVGAGTVSLAWLLKRGAIVIPASKTREHLEANWRAASVALTPADVSAIDALDCRMRLVAPEKSPVWD